MKKFIYALILLLVVVSGLVLANHQFKNETSKQSTPKPLCAAEKNAAMKEWEASPAGMLYKQWEESPAGKKVLASAAKISKQVSDSANMEAVITSLSLPPNSRLGFGIMVNINGDDYILGYGPQKPGELQQLHTLKVGDKIIIRSNGVMHAPKYSYPIIPINYVERDSKIIYKSVPGKGGC